MRDQLKRWLADSLAKRLMWLMWGTLVLSHLLAFSVVRWSGGLGERPDVPAWRGPDRMGAPQHPGPPPEWPLHQPPPDEPLPASRPGANAPGRAAPPMPVFPSLPPTPGMPGGGPRALSTGSLLLDYGVRLLVIAIAAWLGARWLSRPLRRLAQASAAMAQTLRRGQAVPKLDEAEGTREVRALAQSFNRMSGQLQRQFEGRALMVAAISHDLRTPLTRLRMRLETQDDLNKLRTQGVADLREMNDLIDSVLQVFRPQSALAEPLRPVRVAALLQALVDDAQELGQPVTLAGACDPERSVPAQPQALRRILDNLVGNALRYGRCARLSLAEENGRLALRVDDDGPGIPEHLLDAVFEPFVRVEASRHRAGGGVGLGLYIARQLAECMGAELLLSNRPEGGLRATLRF